MLRDELARGVAPLRDVGIDSPRLDAELLLAHALGVDRASLVVSSREEVPPEALLDYGQMLERRAAREPVAYVLGERQFRRLTLTVDRRVLIPRPETELLVEVGLSLASGAAVADVGTGSGAIALALADERPDLVVTGIDVSADALSVAVANARRLGLDSVRWVQGDLLDGGAYDAVLANLPYVASAAPLAPEISRFEPAAALFAGEDGLDAIRALTGQVGRRDDVTLLALEVGFDQADAVASGIGDAGFSSVERVRDLAGHERVIVGRR